MDTMIAAPRLGLAGLENLLRADLAKIAYPHREWLPSRVGSEPVLNVLIVGAGQSGLSAAFGLLREKVTNILVIDAKPAGGEGPWRDFARMRTLRTPKHVTGPDLGIPNLTFQSWYEARFGEAAWAELRLIPKELWADYLAWYREFLALPVRNGLRAGRLAWNPGLACWEVPVSGAEAGTAEVLLARKVVLATGIDGSGRWETPAVVRDIPKRFWAHTNERIDFDGLAGRRVAVLGAGASAFDNASVALESGAAAVDLFFRRKRLVDVNPYRWAEFTGFLKHHADLDDADKWRFMARFVRMGQLPPADTLARATGHAHFALHPGSPWLGLRHVGEQVEVTTPHGSQLFDFLIFGTGFTTDLTLRPELAGVVDQVALWEDVYRPPAELAFPELGRYPYLGPAGQFRPRNAEAAPWISSLFCYNYAGLASLGFAGAFISGLRYSLPKLVDGITAQLYRDHAEHFYASLEAYDVREF